MKQFLFELRHNCMLHLEHCQYVFLEQLSSLHRVLFKAETNKAQWLELSYRITFVTMDLASRNFFPCGLFSS